ncbi:MAG: RNA-binding protein [Verrucomicrobia bacterium]|nr:RNA-binding protein [Verrucomicrobiota bacterium]
MSIHSSPTVSGFRSHKPPVQEETLKSEKIQVERKTFILVLKENARGRFLRITEDVGGRRDSIIVPSTGLEDFKRIVDDMLRASQDMPIKPEPVAL